MFSVPNSTPEAELDSDRHPSSRLRASDFDLCSAESSQEWGQGFDWERESWNQVCGDRGASRWCYQLELTVVPIPLSTNTKWHQAAQVYVPEKYTYFITYENYRVFTQYKPSRAKISLQNNTAVTSDVGKITATWTKLSFKETLQREILRSQVSLYVYIKSVYQYHYFLHVNKIIEF